MKFRYPLLENAGDGTSGGGLVGGGGGSTTPAGGGGSSESSGSTPAASAPATASEALESAAARLGSESSPDQTGEADPNAGVSTGRATTTPAQPGSTRGTDGTPQHRIEAAVKNAREAIEQELGWARAIGNRADAERAINLIRRLDQNPLAFLQQLAREVGVNQQPQQREEEEELVDPDPDLVSEPDAQGNRQKTYSDAKVKQLLGNLEKRLMKQFQPTIQFANRATAQERVRAQMQRGNQIADAALSKLEKMPGFKENSKAIGEELAKMTPEYRAEIGGAVAALYEAYLTVRERAYTPVQQQLWEKQYRESQLRKANASTGQIQPQTQGEQKPAIREGNVDDLDAHMSRIAAQMANGSV